MDVRNASFNVDKLLAHYASSDVRAQVGAPKTDSAVVALERLKRNGPTFTAAQLDDFVDLTAEMRDKVKRDNTAKRGSGLLTDEDKDVEVVVGQMAVGARCVQLLVTTAAQIGELARFAVDTQPGAGDALGGVFG